MKTFFENRTEGFIALFLFLVLWTYLWLRAIYVPLVHDELVTLHAYMLNGKWLPFQGFLDANNHILNSAFGAFFIQLFGYKTYLIPRLPNLLCFPIYFGSTFLILKKLELKNIALFGALTLFVFPPYLLEFFALARGYGMAMAFFILALLAFLKLSRNIESKSIWLLAISSSLSVLSNLTLLFANAGLLLLFLLLIIDQKKFRKSCIIPLIIPVLVFGFMAWYGTQLQASGKLYYGSNDGFFALTVNSLMKELFFLEGSSIQWILKIGGSFLIVLAISKLFKSPGLKNLTTQPYLIFTALFSICLMGIFSSNILLKVNFPEDRAALYLFPLFGLMIVALITSLKATIYKPVLALFIIIFTPLLVFNINLSHSIFWHHDHIHSKFIQEVNDFTNQKGYPPTMAGKVIHQSVWGQTAKEKEKVFNSLQRYENNSIDTVAEMQLALLNRYPKLNKFYSEVFFDEISGLSLLKRKKMLQRKLIASKKIEPQKSNEEFLMLWINLPDSLAQQHILLSISGGVSRSHFPSEVILIASDENNQGQKVYYEVYGFDIMLKPHQTQLNISMYIPDMETPSKAGFYIWNKEKVEMEISELNLNLYKLTNN